MPVGPSGESAGLPVTSSTSKRRHVSQSSCATISSSGTTWIFSADRGFHFNKDVYLAVIVCSVIVVLFREELICLTKQSHFLGENRLWWQMARAAVFVGNCYIERIPRHKHIFATAHLCWAVFTQSSSPSFFFFCITVLQSLGKLDVQNGLSLFLFHWHSCFCSWRH